MSESYDDERRAVEGVRILGAEEARASLGETRADPTTTEEPVDLAEEEPQLDLRDPAPAFRTDDAMVSAGPNVGESSDAVSGRSDATWSADHDDILPGREPMAGRSAATPMAPLGASAGAGQSPDAAAVDAPPIMARVVDDADEAPTGEIPPLPHWTEPPTGAVPAIFADDAEPADDADAWATVTGAQPRFRSGSDWAESDFAEDLSDEDVKLGALSNEGPVDEEAAFERDLAARRKGPATGTATRRAPRPRPASARPDADRASRDAPPPARDLPTAIMTGLAVAVVAIVSFTHNATAVALACVVVGVATLELAISLRKRGLRPATLVALTAATLLPVAARHYGTSAYPVFFAMVVIVSLLWFLWEITPGRPLPGVASTVLVFAYVGGLGGFAGLLLGSPKGNGVRLLLGVALCVIAYDVVGFFVGSRFGHTAVAPKISPNKTVEGTVAGMIASVVVGAAIVGHFIHPWTIGRGLALGVLVAVGAFVGDLCESMLKRDLDLKDFGSLLPGHGGLLDRFDSLLFCLPIAYYLALQFKIY